MELVSDYDYFLLGYIFYTTVIVYNGSSVAVDLHTKKIFPRSNNNDF